MAIEINWRIKGLVCDFTQEVPNNIGQSLHSSELVSADSSISAFNVRYDRSVFAFGSDLFQCRITER